MNQHYIVNCRCDQLQQLYLYTAVRNRSFAVAWNATVYHLNKYVYTEMLSRGIRSQIPLSSFLRRDMKAILFAVSSSSSLCHPGRGPPAEHCERNAAQNNEKSERVCKRPAYFALLSIPRPLGACHPHSRCVTTNTNTKDGNIKVALI